MRVAMSKNQRVYCDDQDFCDRYDRETIWDFVLGGIIWCIVKAGYAILFIVLALSDLYEWAYSKVTGRAPDEQVPLLAERKDRMVSWKKAFLVIAAITAVMGISYALNNPESVLEIFEAIRANWKKILAITAGMVVLLGIVLACIATQVFEAFMQIAGGESEEDQN